MKLTRILIVSVGLNLVLLAVFVGLRQQPHAFVSTPSEPSKQVLTTVTGEVVQAKVEALSVTNAPFDWSSIGSTNHHLYVANLRAMDCPERLVAEIIWGDISRLYRKKLYAGIMAIALPPWANRDRVQERSWQRLAARLSQREEQRALIKEVLGYEWSDEMNEWESGFLETELAFLPREKVATIWKFYEEGEQVTADVYDSSKGILIDEDFARIKKQVNELYLKLAGVLTPDELNEFVLRTQLMGMHDEIHLEGVALNGAELREIAERSKILKDVMHEGLMGPESDVSAEEKARRQAEFDKAVSEILGPQRFADYQLAQNPDFQQAFQFTAQNQLPRETAIKLSSLVAEVRAQAEQIEQDKTLSNDEQAAAMKVLAATTQNSVRSLLGITSEKFFEENGEMLGALSERMEESTP